MNHPRFRQAPEAPGGAVGFQGLRPLQVPFPAFIHGPGRRLDDGRTPSARSRVPFRQVGPRGRARLLTFARYSPHSAGNGCRDVKHAVERCYDERTHIPC
jgi:hypothetical protein